ncbi:MAG: type II secretion system protein E, partial [Candidatus Heteroscillospira sp.]
MSLGKKRSGAAFSGKKKRPQAEQKKQPPIQPSAAPVVPNSENSKVNSALNRPVDFAGANRAHALFFTPEAGGKDFSSVLTDVQAYISGHYSTLLTEGGEDAKAQMKRYIQKFL